MMGVVCFIDAYGNTIRAVCDLRYGIDNQAVILCSVIGCHHIQAVPNLKQSSEILLISCLIVLCQIVFAEFFCHSLELF